MLKGLEISEVRLKDIGLKTSDFRIDSEYFTGKFAQYCRLMEKCGCTYFAREAQKAVKGAFDITADKFREAGIPFVRISNIRDMELDASSMVYIDADVHAKYIASELRRGDIVLSKTAYAAASIVTLPVCNTSQDTIAISLNPDSCIDPYFTVVYLNTRYGLFLMEYLFTGNVQKHFNLTECKTKLPIPIFSKKFQGEIRNLFSQALAARSESNKVYREAEQMLLADLGFAGWSPTDAAVSVKSYSDFLSAGRFDAEYFQPKYDDYEDHINSYKGGCHSLKTFVKQNTTLCKRELPDYQYVEIGDVNIGDTEYSTNRILAENLPANAKIMAKKGDVIISKVRPNRGAVTIIGAAADDLVVSGAFTVVSATGDLCKEVLLVLLRTWIYRDWFLKWTVGSSYPVLKDEDVLNIPVPLVDKMVQRDIVAKVQSSFALRAESKRLLDLAKHAVEMAIEQGEEKAISALNKEV